jgi:hypothetical protein
MAMSFIWLATTGLFAGLLIGLNPVLISSFNAYITALIGRGVSNKRYTIAGLLFIAYFSLFTLFFGLGFSNFISYLGSDIKISIALIFSMLGILQAGLLIRRYFYPEPVIIPPKNVSNILHQYTTKKRGPLNLIGLSLILAYATLPTIGLAIALMSVLGSLTGSMSLVWQIPFCIGLITPIYIVLALLSSHTRPSAILTWKEKSKAVMRLYSGLAILALAWMILYTIINGGF